MKTIDPGPYERIVFLQEPGCLRKVALPPVGAAAYLEPVSKGGVCMSKHFVSTMSGRSFPGFEIVRKG